MRFTTLSHHCLSLPLSLMTVPFPHTHTHKHTDPSLSLFFCFHLILSSRNKVTDNTITPQPVMVEFGNLVGPLSNHSHAVLVSLHHGVVGITLGKARDLHQRPSHVLPGVHAIVVDADFPLFTTTALSLFRGSRFLLLRVLRLRLCHGWFVQYSGGCSSSRE